MVYLAVKYKNASLLFVQSREKREKDLDDLKKRKKKPDTLVVKTFDNYKSCYDYCIKMNKESLTLKDIFHKK